MAVKINFNAEAAKTHTALIYNERLMGKSLLRLSTGVRILNASDDAAGLYIADMLGTVAAALEQGNANIQTGISALQIAESAAGQIYTKLQEIYIRAQRAANDINDSNARAALQQEINNFIDAINKIGTDTEYNGIKLLDGTFTNKYIHYGARKDQTVLISVSSLKASELGAQMVTGDGRKTSGTGTISSSAGDKFLLTPNEYLKVAEVSVLSVSSGTYLVDAAEAAKNINTNTTLNSLGIEATAKNVSTPTDGFSSIVTIVSGNNVTISNLTLNFYIGQANVSSPSFSVTGLSVNTTLEELVAKINSAASANNKPVTASAENGKLVLRTDNGETIGIEVSLNVSGTSPSVKVNLNQLLEGAGSETISSAGSHTFHAIKVGTLTIAGLNSFVVSENGIDIVGESGTAESSIESTYKNLTAINVSTNTGAEEALLVVTKAMQKVDTIRAQIGATMNNLQSIFDSQKVAYDNTKEAESVIRNTDYAKEMSEFVTYQIRMQATVAMLAQANTLPQLVLQLMR